MTTVTTPDNNTSLPESVAEFPGKINEAIKFMTDHYDIQPRIHEYIRPPSREQTLPALDQVLTQIQALPWQSEIRSDDSYVAIEPYKAVHAMTIVDDRKEGQLGRLWIRYNLSGAKHYDSLPENQIMSLDAHINTQGNDPMKVAQDSQTPLNSVYIRFADGNAVHYSLKKSEKPDLVTQVTGGPDAIGIHPGKSLSEQTTGGGDAF